jgi:hypothetical protein
VESGCTLLVVHCRANRALLIAVEIAEVQDSDRKSSRKPASKAELRLVLLLLARLYIGKSQGSRDEHRDYRFILLCFWCSYKQRCHL